MIIIFIFFTGSRLSAQDYINVTVSNLHSNKGHVLISLFSECDGFPDEPLKAARKAQAYIINNTASYVFSGLPSGNYSVAILHDENDDSKMNTNFFGIPKEGYGFSNNVMGSFGPPSCSRAEFRHIANSVTAINIRTRYGW
jgi:uncharacterized protein (DUF2141 family)